MKNEVLVSLKVNFLINFFKFEIILKFRKLNVHQFQDPLFSRNLPIFLRR